MNFLTEAIFQNCLAQLILHVYEYLCVQIPEKRNLKDTTGIFLVSITLNTLYLPNISNGNFKLQYVLSVEVAGVEHITQLIFGIWTIQIR